MVIVDNSTFIIKLEKMAVAARKASSFTVTFKRYNGQTKPMPKEGNPPLPQPEAYFCLVRAKSKSKKLSTIVHQEDVARMMTMYAQFMKSSIDGLKRVKKVKTKAKAARG